MSKKKKKIFINLKEQVVPGTKRNIIAYLRNIITNLQNSDTWKIQLTIAINFSLSKDTSEECVMQLMSDKIKFTSYNDVNKVANEIFELLFSKYENNLETSMRGSDF